MSKRSASARRLEGNSSVPYDLDAERAVLGAAITSSNAHELVLRRLAADDFYKPTHRKTFTVLARLAARGKKIDEYVVAAALNGIEDAPKIFVHELVHAAGALADTNTGIDLVRETAHRRRRLSLVERERKALLNGSHTYELPKIDAARQELLEDNVTGVLEPIDLAAAFEHPAESLDWLHEPFIPAARRVWAFGGAESGKSMFAAWVAARLTQDGHEVVYVSAENPLSEELRRFRRLGPDVEKLALFHDAGIDLARAEDAAALIQASRGASLVVLDTLSAVWSGDENDNAAISALDREFLVPLVKATGATVLVLDHVGHPQHFVTRKGVNAGRGASAKGQKADVVLEFVAKREHSFILRVGKMRGGDKPEKVLKVVDLPDGSLDVAVQKSEAPSEDMRDEILDLVRAAGEEGMNTRGIHDAITGQGTAISAALEHMFDAGLLTRREEKRPDRAGRNRTQTIWRVT